MTMMMMICKNQQTSKTYSSNVCMTQSNMYVIMQNITTQREKAKRVLLSNVKKIAASLCNISPYPTRSETEDDTYT